MEVRFIQSIMRVIRTLFDAVKYLEKTDLPQKFDNIYLPMEELSDCELFQRPLEQLNSSHIKVSKPNTYTTL